METVFKDKFEATKAALGDLVFKEKNMISEETMVSSLHFGFFVY